MIKKEQTVIRITWKDSKARNTKDLNKKPRKANKERKIKKD